MTTGLSNSCAYLIAICVSVVLVATFVFCVLYQQKASITYVEYDSAKEEAYPVDAVYTWVDPTDPTWKQAYATHVPPTKTTVSKKRFNNNVRGAPDAELQTSVELLLKFCPWVRTVYIATMRPQVPPFLQNAAFASLVKSGRIRVVHHDEFFEHASVLPVFNSRPIEANLHRIPGLAKQWLYLNDDMMTGKPVEKNMLFYNGTPVIRGKFVPVLSSLGTWFNPHVSGWMNNGKLLRYAWYFHNDHNVTAHDRDVVATISDTLTAHAPEWSRMLQARVRDHGQLVPLGLVENMALNAGFYVRYRNNPVKTLFCLSNTIIWKDDMRKLSDYHFFCINNLPTGSMIDKLNAVRTAHKLAPLNP